MKERKMVKANTLERWGEIITFENIGDNVEGVIYGIREIKTEYGIAPIMDLKTDDGLKFSIILSSALQQYSFGDKIGHFVSITYVGSKKNIKTKRHFKDFEVSLSADIEEVIPSDFKEITSEDLPF